MHEGINRAYGARWLVREVLSLGIPAESLLSGTGLQESWVHNEKSTISYQQYCQLVENALFETQEPSLGLTIGRKFHLGEFGLYGYAMMSSSTLGEALKIGLDFWELGGHLLKTSHRLDEESFSIQFLPATPLVKDRILIYGLEAIIAATQAAYSAILNRFFPLKQIQLTHSAPPYSTLYNTIFDCPVLFDRPKNEIEIAIDALDYPIVTANADIAKISKQNCEELLYKLKETDAFVDEIRRILLETPGHFPQLDDIAKSLGLSSRTLFRRLKDRNTSFQKILDEVRTEIAVKYLKRTNISIDQVSDLVGFAETTTFRRRFKKWTGLSPSAMRKQNN